MAQETVGIRELKTRLGTYVRQVKLGGTLVITERGKPIIRLVPVEMSIEAQTRALMRAGLIAWSGKKVRIPKHTPRTRGKKTVSEILLENRE